MNLYNVCKSWQAHSSRNWTRKTASCAFAFVAMALMAYPISRALGADGLLASGVAVNTIINVSAASYFSGGEIAAESIVAGFSVDLATTTAVAASVPLPTLLAGVRVMVKDDLGVERFAPLFFVSPGQINYQIPPGTALGVATMTVTNNNNVVATGSAKILRVVPGLFAANANGQGVAAALTLRVRADNSLSYEPVAQFNAQQGRMVAVPIDLGPATDQVFLVLYGTGLKFLAGLDRVSSQVGGLNCQVLYAGAAPGFAGLDQINVRLSRQLAGRGEVEIALIAEARAANPLRITIQ